MARRIRTGAAQMKLINPDCLSVRLEWRSMGLLAKSHFSYNWAFDYGVWEGGEWGRCSWIMVFGLMLHISVCADPEKQVIGERR